MFRFSMKYSLRSLMIAVLVGPPLLALGLHCVGSWLVNRKSEISIPQTRGPPITFDLTPRETIGTTEEGIPIVDLDVEFHQRPAP